MVRPRSRTGYPLSSQSSSTGFSVLSWFCGTSFQINTTITSSSHNVGHALVFYSGVFSYPLIAAIYMPNIELFVLHGHHNASSHATVEWRATSPAHQGGETGSRLRATVAITPGKDVDSTTPPITALTHNQVFPSWPRPGSCPPFHPWTGQISEEQCRLYQNLEKRAASHAAICRLRLGHPASVHKQLRQILSRHPEDGETYLRRKVDDRDGGRKVRVRTAWPIRRTRRVDDLDIIRESGKTPCTFE